MTDAQTQLLIVIPCLNEENHLKKIVDGLITSPGNDNVRIVIADGGSTDRTVQIARDLARNYKQIAYLHNPMKRQAAALNLAVSIYGREANFLIRIDAHADYPTNYCRALLDEALRTHADAVVVSLRTIGKTLFQKAVAAAQNSKLGNGGSAHRLTGNSGRWIDHGHHALMRLEAFRAVGGYDESFAYNEDAELDYRLTQAGRKIWLTGKTSPIYYPRSTPGELFNQYVRYGRGRVQTIIKHHAKLKLRQMLPACILPAALLMLLTPWFGLAALPLLLWLVLCLAYGVVLTCRAKEISIALAGPAATLMHAGWSLGFWQEALNKLWKR